jgi:UDP-N-acetyl-D-mannosaminuronic acid dehydrogenase
MKPRFTRDVAVVGGCGHVGLPLALTFADIGLRTVIYDIDRCAVESVRAGEMPFHDDGASEMLLRVLLRQTLEVCDEPDLLAESQFVVLIIGTPVDEHLNPSFGGIFRALDSCRKYLRSGQILILRSTIYPGMSEQVRQYLAEHHLNVAVAFCPERVAQGQSLREFRQLPQIISAFDPETLFEVGELFGKVAPELVEMEPMEAELCKLMTNAWRYIQFSIVNQFFMIATDNGLDFSRILYGCRHHYPRMASMPSPGLTAGPCLVKDTMQLAAFSQNTFVLGHAAMLVNEGLPAHLISLAKRQTGLRNKTVGILGMTFKAGSDDTRDSLSFKLRKLLTLEARRILCHDPYAPKIPDAARLDQVLAEADVIFLATPHPDYRDLIIPPRCVVIDVWDFLNPSNVVKGKASKAAFEKVAV